jgi:exonuclease SbcC
MRLVQLRLQNFRQHAETRIDFQPGLTGIIGPNGAGKSTILEAIAWAIYGAGAARGTNETIRFARAPGRARVLVELVFELSGHVFRVNRTLNSADVFLDDGVSPVASGTSGVSGYLEQRIGMSRDEFFNTYYTGQKELQFLAQMGARDRGRFLAQVLGYERLRQAQDRARERRKELTAEATGIREVLPDPDELRARAEEAKQRVKAARAAVSDAEQQHAQRSEALEQWLPRWLDVQQKRERMREVEQEIAAARRDGEAAQRDVERAGMEMERIRQAEEQLVPLRAELQALPAVARQCEELARLAPLAERRRALEETEKLGAAELEVVVGRLEELESAPELLKQHGPELDQLKQRLAAADAQLTELRNEWSAQRQDVRTKLQHHLERHDELKLQIDQLRAAGPDGTCPTCTRPLGREFERVMRLLEDQFEEVTQNGKWLRKRQTQLEQKPDDVTRAEEAQASLKSALDTLAQRVARCEQAVQEIWTLTGERRKKEKRLEQLRSELAELPTGYDPAAHEKAQARLRTLNETEQRAARFDQVLDRRAERERELAEANQRARAALLRLQSAAALEAEIAFDARDYEHVRAQHDQAARMLHQSEIALTDARARHDAAREHESRVKADARTAEQNRARLLELELDVRHHNELDNALQQLRQELNARVRPELSDLASRFLNDITDGRYTALEIDENYNIIVLDEGEEKPVISGGEEDVANLVLRIAISQMIAERAGQQLSVLFLDEVFGSLDLERRDSVVQLLHRLEDRFEQVVLITHIETIREGLDHTIRVNYDERTGSSVVQEETSRRPELVTSGSE